MTRNIVLILGMVLALGAGVLYYVGPWTIFEKITDRPLLDEAEDTVSGFRIGLNAIYVADQIPGQSIAIDVVALGEAGFVVIHEAEGEKPKAIIGASRLLPYGDTATLPIVLSRQVLHGETFFAMLHRDNGDELFDPTQDTPIVSGNGEPFMMQFMIDEKALEPGVISL